MTINIDADPSNADWTKTTPHLQMNGPEAAEGGDVTLTDEELKHYLATPQAQFVPAVWPGQEPVDGDRAAELLRFVTLGEPKPADLTPAESAMWARQAKGVAEAKAKGLTVDFPNE